ncbi:hypothetical protein [Herminiimonas sp. CN]|uniref:hypothetical protein n=1 Tax=Herminiimonas sp. CN TaxID=1349818 RepID=UPI000B0187D9|nr:hypothetical protein [Herminiimonas sp. CN]
MMVLPLDDIALESKVAFLRQPTSFPEPTYRVETMETHMSWIFLTDGYAYKLKKPVHYDALDFRTIAARHHFCDEEVRLNRRLAGTVYVGVVSLTVDQVGHLQLDGCGVAIDFLIKMRRLPARHMLDYAIRDGTAHAEDIGKIAALLSSFYHALPPVAIHPAAYRNRFLATIEQNLRTLSAPAYQLPVEQVKRVCAAQHTALQHMSGLFDERVLAGKIIEGHGDLRPEHICLRPDLVIIDCLEFSPQMRQVDAVDELGFLALECERLDASDFGALLLKNYEKISGDRPAPALVHFYQSYRACIRAAIAIRHLDEEKFRHSAEWPRRAREYLQLAELHIRECS